MTSPLALVVPIATSIQSRQDLRMEPSFKGSRPSAISAWVCEKVFSCPRIHRKVKDGRTGVELYGFVDANVVLNREIRGYLQLEWI